VGRQSRRDNLSLRRLSSPAASQEIGKFYLTPTQQHLRNCRKLLQLLLLRRRQRTIRTN